MSYDPNPAKKEGISILKNKKYETRNSNTSFFKIKFRKFELRPQPRRKRTKEFWKKKEYETRNLKTKILKIDFWKY